MQNAVSRVEFTSGGSRPTKAHHERAQLLSGAGTAGLVALSAVAPRLPLSPRVVRSSRDVAIAVIGLHLGQVMAYLALARRRARIGSLARIACAGLPAFEHCVEQLRLPPPAAAEGRGGHGSP